MNDCQEFVEAHSIARNLIKVDKFLSATNKLANFK